MAVSKLPTVGACILFSSGLGGLYPVLTSQNQIRDARVVQFIKRLAARCAVVVRLMLLVSVFPVSFP